MKLILILLISMLLSEAYTQQSLKDSVYNHFKHGSIIALASSFPIYISMITFKSPTPSNQKIMYGGVWLSFGISLDIVAIGEYRKAYKLKKQIKNYEKI